MNTFKTPKADWLGAPTEALTGFSWRSGMTADTQGILFWNDIFLYDDPNGEKIAIIIMDTQGLFEPGVSSDFNSRIFGLSTLISSIQVINLSGVIQEDQLQYLEMSVEFTKLANRKNSGTSNLKPFQDLIFLVRDWPDEDTGLGYVGGKKVWKKVVEASSGNPGAESVRKNINKAFDKISTFLLPHPGLEVTKKAFDGAYGKLDVDFTAHLKELIESIFKADKLVVKKLYGVEVKGDDFKELIDLYIKTFSSNELPKVESIFEAQAKREMEKIIAGLLIEYKKLVTSNVNFNDRNFMNDFHQKTLKTKQNLFKKFQNTPKMGNEASENEMKKILSDKIQEIFLTVKKDVEVKYENHKNHLREVLMQKQRLVEIEARKQKIIEEQKRQEEEQRRLEAERDKKRIEEAWKIYAEISKTSARNQEIQREIQASRDKRLGVTPVNKNSPEYFLMCILTIFTVC